MARKTASRMEKRREAEAVAARGSATDGKAKKKKAARKKTTTRRKSKAKASIRKRLIWAVFNGSMKEEARFPYDQREAAEEKLEQLRAKSTKKLYFIQPLKEEITGEAPAAEAGKETAAAKE